MGEKFTEAISIPLFCPLSSSWFSFFLTSFLEEESEKKEGEEKSRKEEEKGEREEGTEIHCQYKSWLTIQLHQFFFPFFLTISFILSSILSFFLSSQSFSPTSQFSCVGTGKFFSLSRFHFSLSFSFFLSSSLLEKGERKK